MRPHTLVFSTLTTIYQYQNNPERFTMLFESIEIRKVRNGVIVTLRTDEDEDQEYVYDSDRKAIKFVKDLLETKNKEQAPA